MKANGADVTQTAIISTLVYFGKCDFCRKEELLFNGACGSCRHEADVKNEK